MQTFQSNNFKQWLPYQFGPFLLLGLILFGCTNDNIRVMSQSGILVTPTPEVTPTTNPRLVGVPTEWSDGVKHFPITPVDADGLTTQQTRETILTSIQAIYPENATIGCCGQDIAKYHQKIMHSFANLFAHSSSNGFPYGEIAADANISVYSDSTGGATFGPQLIASTDSFAAITIPNQQNGAGYHRMSPSLYIFDRQQNVYQTNVHAHLYKVVPIDNGLFLTLNPAFNSGDSLSVGYAHIITNTERLQAYSLGNYRTFWPRFFETDFESLTISPDYQTVSIHHVLGKDELPCKVALDPKLQIGKMLVKTEFIRQDKQYIEGKTQIVEVLTVELLEGNNGVQYDTLIDWQSYCRK